MTLGLIGIALALAIPGPDKWWTNWLSVARAEVDWLSWALAKKGLPTIGKMLVGK